MQYPMALTVGLPYFLLSTTGPLVQAWFVREQSKPGASAYRLYALSNLGSMLALLSYPVLFEPAFGGETVVLDSRAVARKASPLVFAALAANQPRPSG